MFPAIYYEFIECLKCGVKYYYPSNGSNAHNCPNCGVSHEDHFNCKTVGIRVNSFPKKYIYPEFKKVSER